MHSITDAELESWHDYEVESPREIVALLRQISEKNQPIRMLVKGEADVCVTSLLDVDPDTNTLILDRSANPEQNAHIADSSKITCETSLDKIRILFSLSSMRSTMFQGGPAFTAEIPATLIRLQRREFYRMQTPVTNPVRATIPLPDEHGGAPAVFPLADISCGGIAIFDNKQQLGEAVGVTYADCRIELPEIGTVVCTLQVRNVIEMTLLNNKTSRRLGCQFIDISRGNAAAVQRYITKLERERNSRIAGLA